MGNGDHSARVTLQHPLGVPAELTICAPSVAELVKRVDKLVSLLADKGWVPIATCQPVTAGTDAPVCPIHKKPMKASQHGGWYCPVKIAPDDGSGKPVYCKATA